MTTGKTIDLTRWIFVSKVMSLLFKMLSRFVINIYAYRQQIGKVQHKAKKKITYCFWQMSGFPPQNSFCQLFIPPYFRVAWKKVNLRSSQQDQKQSRCNTQTLVTQLDQMKVKVKVVIQLCLTICAPMECSTPGSSVHGILQARILEQVVMSSSRGSS